MKTVIARNSLKLKAAGMALLSALSATHAVADDYDYIQLHALRAEYANIPGFTLLGAEVRGGFSLGQVFGEFRYRDLRDRPDLRELDEDRWNVSLGYAFPSSTKTHFDVRLNYGEVNVAGSSPQGALDAGVDYFGISTYVHHQISTKTRVYAGLEQQNWQGGATQKAYHLGTMYKFDWISLGAEYTKYSDSDAISLFARYSF